MEQRLDLAPNCSLTSAGALRFFVPRCLFSLDIAREVLWICIAIAVLVFGAMLYSLVKFRRSQRAIPDSTMLQSATVEIIWTIIPVIILVVMAVPAANLILKQEDTRSAELSIRVTGYQWKWQYQSMDAAGGGDYECITPMRRSGWSP
jgi:heme/copper-type cytochrome/quinol oxidase subunit 2